MECLHPFTRRIVDPAFKGQLFGKGLIRSVLVPCQKCPTCLQNRRQSWAFRCQQEALAHKGNTFFCTLTYEDKSLPYGTSAPSLCKSDLTDFFKRLTMFYVRKFNSYDENGKQIKPFTYYACGEYGDSLGRPHYHFLIFFEYKITKKQLLSDLKLEWKFCSPQSIEVDDFSVQRAEYVAKYALKQYGIDYDGVEPPFALMSKGIGKSFITDEHIKQIRTNQSLVVRDMSGTPFQLPKFYTDSGKFFSRDELRNLSEIRSHQRALLEEFKLSVDSNYIFKRRKSLEAFEREFYDKVLFETFGKSLNLKLSEYGKKCIQYERFSGIQGKRTTRFEESSLHSVDFYGTCRSGALCNDEFGTT